MLKLIQRLLIVGVALTVHLPAMAFESYRDDLIPWPWGTECPFPWKNIEGQWSTKQKENPESFTFEVRMSSDKKSRILQLRRYNEKGELIGQGEGVAPLSEKIVQLSMYGVGYHEGLFYIAMVRTYVEAPTRSCTKGKQVTVITLRASDGADSHDTHVIIEKEHN